MVVAATVRWHADHADVADLRGQLSAGSACHQFLITIGMPGLLTTVDTEECTEGHGDRTLMYTN